MFPTEKKQEKLASKPARKKQTTKKNSTDMKKRTNKPEEWITNSGQGNIRQSSQPDKNIISNKNITSTLTTFDKNIFSNPSISNTQVISVMNPQPTAQPINAKTSSGQRVIFTSNQLQTVASGQNLQTLHSLPSGQTLQTNASGQNLQPLTSGQNQTNLAQQQVLVNPAISNTSIITSLPYHHSPRPVKTILPNTLAPATNIGNNFQVVLPNHLISQPSSQVYVPAMTASD